MAPPRHSWKDRERLNDGVAARAPGSFFCFEIIIFILARRPRTYGNERRLNLLALHTNIERHTLKFSRKIIVGMAISAISMTAVEASAQTQPLAGGFAIISSNGT